MKKFLICLAICCLLAGCAASPKPVPTTAAITEPATTAPAVVTPLPVSIDMAHLDNCTIAVSMEEGDAYVDDEGYMQMDVTVYAYDLYDLVDISRLKEGDTMILRQEPVLIETIEESSYGSILINGGLDLGGYELVTGEDTVYYETGYSDVKSWYALGNATIRVSPDFVYTDRSDLDRDPILYYPGDFLIPDTGIDYDFTPHNCTITIQDGLAISMEKIYTP